jgi:uncharacterized protein (DUF924 family)
MTPTVKGAVATPPEDVVSFWIDEIGAQGWYKASDALDATIRDRFGAAWDTARAHGGTGWTPSPQSALATVILLDQFPRNMFRDDAKSFATDRLAMSKAKHAIDTNWDMRIDGAARQFFYLPLMHSECLVDQERCVRLFKERMPDADDNLIHAKAHRDVIRKFGRFPYRNAVLGRKSTAQEQAFLDTGGYGAVVNALRAAV